MPTRISLDAPAAPARKAIDANWSAKKKRVVAGLCIGFGTLAVAAGSYFAWMHRPVSLPKTREEAMKVMASDRYKNLDEERKRQYAVVAAELFKDIPREEMRTYFQDESTREALFAMREQAMDEMILKLARGEPVEDMRMGWRPGGGGPGGPRPDGQRPDGERREGGPGGPGGGPGGGGEMTEEQRQQRRAEMTQRIRDRIGNSVNDGNAQMNGLRSEFMSRMRAQMEQGSRPRGPG